MFVRRGLATPTHTSPARDLITTWYAKDYDPDRLTEYTQLTFAPEHGRHPALLGLYTATGAAEIAQDLLTDPAPVTTTQVQIRIPADQLSAGQPEKTMHVDGVGCPHLDPAELRTFSLLVGVALSPITRPDAGALHYVRGGHQTMSRWFASEWARGITDQVPPDIDTTDGAPLLADVGDVLFMHHLVPHAVGTNHTATPRLMAYFRVSHAQHAARRLDALRNPWLDYPSLSA
ncbi:phytanoyl-CoA dioxygenase family protein [Streptomyces antarcticus]|uniref:phytanoyl-CoA dioxygenase family protein n=1 Tax=Streptomyces antarcticus TaxID=2996458 RepID=UPI00226F0760|nr:phytanoyl-CoA dioxygenase family protein [Streptomyces sp. H34-AA3]MCY0945663.1 phytanoyl-CoA dioxygenase family protein [Streptomyces sp. H34-AA3]